MYSNIEQLTNVWVNVSHKILEHNSYFNITDTSINNFSTIEYVICAIQKLKAICFIR
jgi:hypothetical protein